ncbi:ClpP/crotonase-like domain-containing protein [Haematococcus lacustris]
MRCLQGGCAPSCALRIAGRPARCRVANLSVTTPGHSLGQLSRARRWPPVVPAAPNACLGRCILAQPSAWVPSCHPTTDNPFPCHCPSATTCSSHSHQSSTSHSHHSSQPSPSLSPLPLAQPRPPSSPSLPHLIFLRGLYLLAAALLVTSPASLPLLTPPPASASMAATATPSGPRCPSTRPGSCEQQLILKQQQPQQAAAQARPQELTPLGLASEVEEQLLEAARQIEARLPVLPLLPQATQAVISAEERLQNSAAAQALVQEVWDVVDQNYLDARGSGWQPQRWAQLRDEALDKPLADAPAAYRAIREMLARGLSDPYCRFITPAELAAMKKYDVTGVGLNLGTAAEYSQKTGRPLPPDQPADDSGVFVVGLSKGSPADQAGMRQGDQVLQVDGRDVAQTSPFQVSSWIAGQAEGEQGPRSSTVELQVVSWEEGRPPRTLSIARPVQRLDSPVTASLTAAGGTMTGEMRLSAFNARAQRDLAQTIRKLEQLGAQSLVLDLRDNRGGLVSEGLEVARLFLEGDQPIVFTESRAPSSSTPRATGPALTRLPLLVLVNERTASASEIVAGALHDNCRAVLVGGRTFGKGLIQSVYELSDGSGLVLTVGKYLTPNRTDIDRSGIEPDFATRPSQTLAAQRLNACMMGMTQSQVASVPGASRLFN